MNTKLNFRSVVFKRAYLIVKKTGCTFSQALTLAWGTLNEKYLPKVTGEDTRRKNDTVQTYFDTERQEWRCFKKLNFIA